MGLCVLGLALLSSFAPDPSGDNPGRAGPDRHGFAFFASPNTNAIMSSVHPADYGVA